MSVDTLIALAGVVLGGVALKVAIGASRTAKQQLECQKKAYLYMELEKDGLPEIAIINAGPGVARNIRIEHEAGNPVFAPVRQSLVCEELAQGQRFRQYVKCDSFTKKEHKKCRIVWDDDTENNQFRDFKF